MSQECWQINEHGFLIKGQPLLSLSGYLDDSVANHLDELIERQPDLLETAQFREQIDQLSVYAMNTLSDSYALERAFMIYCCFASAYIYATGETPVNRIPAGIAIPLVQLAEKLERPPILAYAPYTLANWQKIDPDGDIVVENLRMPYKFIHKRDAEWFTLIHVEIEAHAGQAINAIPAIEKAINNGESESVIQGLEAIQSGLSAMMRTLKRMPEHCHPSVYYHEVRTYIMSFENIVYEGVVKFRGQAQSFPGETGAQSSIIPALVTLMGIQHETSSMTQYLRIMQNYMPVPHRAFIRHIDPHALRNYVRRSEQTPLTDAYNQTLHQLLEFRKLHIRYARSYIANQSPDSVGTGGTEFMVWLQQLIDETEAQRIR